MRRVIVLALLALLAGLPGLPAPGGAPAEVSYCALGVFLNSPIQAAPGTYRVSGTVTFKKTIYHPGL